MTTYRMTPIKSGTRVRKDHNTFAEVLTSYAPPVQMEGTDLWEAPADGNEVRKGDKWLFVTKADGVRLTFPGWMAYIHKGVPICKNFLVVDDVPSPPEEKFPESFIVRIGAEEKEYRRV